MEIKTLMSLNIMSNLIKLSLLFGCDIVAHGRQNKIFVGHESSTFRKKFQHNKDMQFGMNLPLLPILQIKTLEESNLFIIRRLIIS